MGEITNIKNCIEQKTNNIKVPSTEHTISTYHVNNSQSKLQFLNNNSNNLNLNSNVIFNTNSLNTHTNNNIHVNNPKNWDNSNININPNNNNNSNNSTFQHKSGNPEVVIFNTDYNILPTQIENNNTILTKNHNSKNYAELNHIESASSQNIINDKFSNKPLVNSISSLENTNSNVNSLFNHFLSPLTHNNPYSINGCNTERIEDFELFIAGFMRFTTEDNIYLVAYAILRGIIPSINTNELCNVRVIQNYDADTTNSFPSFIVRSTTTHRAQQILSLKRIRNYYSTKDIDRSLLNEEFLSRLPTTKLFINGVLSPVEYKKYKSLKIIAINLGFSFIWHSGGKFFARWKNGYRAFIFNLEMDLNIFRNTTISTPPNFASLESVPRNNIKNKRESIENK